MSQSTISEGASQSGAVRRDASTREGRVFIAMNNFRVPEGQEAGFEKAWKTRRSYLDGVPGFIRFCLLRGDAGGEYISHSTWQSREAFIAWTKSEAFVLAHRQGSLAGLVQGPPLLKLYESVIAEEAALASA